MAAAVSLVGGNVFAWYWIDGRAERRQRDHEAAMKQQLAQMEQDAQQLAEQREVDQLVLALRTSPEARLAAGEKIRDTVWRDGFESRAGRVGIRALLAALTDANVEIRRTAADYLGTLKVRAVVPNLIKALSDSDDRVRLAATRALGFPGAAEAVPALAEALGSANRDIREATAIALSMMGPKAVAAAYSLVWHMPDRDTDVQAHFRHALLKIGPGAVPSLVPALAHSRVDVRRIAVDILSVMGPQAKEAVPALLQALINPDSQIQGEASDALTKIGPDATPALVAALKDQNAAVRKVVIGALRLNSAAAESVPALTRALEDTDVEVRRAASYALTPGGCGLTYFPTMKLAPERAKIHADVVPALLKALADLDAQVRQNAMAALGLIGPQAEAAIPQVAKFLTDDELSIQQQAAATLGWIGSAAAPVLIQAMADPKTRARTAVVDALRTIGPAEKEIGPVLVKALSDQNPAVQLNAAKALSQFGASDDVVQGLAGLLNAPTYALRRAAVGSLGQLGPGAKAAVPALAKALTKPKEMLADVHQPDEYSNDEKGDQHGSLRFDIVRVLLQLGRDAKAAVPALAQSLTDPYLGIRQNAARTLRRIGPDAAEAVPALIKALDDKDMLQEVLQAFYAIGPAAKEAIPALERVRDTTKEFDQLYANQALKAIRKPE